MKRRIGIYEYWDYWQGERIKAVRLCGEHIIKLRNDEPDEHILFVREIDGECDMCDAQVEKVTV